MGPNGKRQIAVRNCGLSAKKGSHFRHRSFSGLPLRTKHLFPPYCEPHVVPLSCSLRCRRCSLSFFPSITTTPPS